MATRLPEDESIYQVTSAEYAAGRTGDPRNGRGGWQTWGHHDTYVSGRTQIADSHNEYVNQHPLPHTGHPPMIHDEGY